MAISRPTNQQLDASISVAIVATLWLRMAKATIGPPSAAPTAATGAPVVAPTADPSSSPSVAPSADLETRSDLGPPTPSTPSPSLAPGLTYAPSAPPTPRPDANRATASGASWGAAVLSLASAFAAAALAPISTRRA
eukprot:TRINITY_DN1618_c0_g1_i1.p1 TRINITY_DN1618_c0_g1~~TRINITY_DN1618_c0_g1_i1.p1  ORF type:complete len:137 (-),score=19.71 TRINITY_DN1618_c0_g1_i1:233-643(-)